MSDHITVSDEKRELEKAVPPPRALDRDMQEISLRAKIQARAQATARMNRLAAVGREGTVMSGATATAAAARDPACSAVDSEPAPEPAPVMGSRDPGSPAARSDATSAEKPAPPAEQAPKPEIASASPHAGTDVISSQ